MKLKHKIVITGFVLALVITPVLSVLTATVGNSNVYAAGSGTYTFSNSSVQTTVSGTASVVKRVFGIICHNTSGSTCADNNFNILSSPAGGDLYYDYSGMSGSNYVFTLDHSLPGKCTITVSKSSPGKGALLSCFGDNSTVSLGSSNLFTTWVNSGGASSAPKAVSISGSIAIDYGETDSTLQTGASDIIATLKCVGSSSDFCKTQNSAGQSTDSLAQTASAGTWIAPMPASPDEDTLTKNPVTYSAVFKSDQLIAGQKYAICFSGPVMSGQKCTGTITAKSNSVASASTTITGDPSALTSTSDGTGTSTGLGCEDQVPVLGWLLCKLIDGIQNAVGGIYDHIINPLLTLEPISRKTSSGTINPIYTAWSNFRLYGDVFLFIAILVIVFGESLGGGLLDAYSVKKIMPRLLIAALLINISFYLVAIAVDIANIVGTGLSSLITAPFSMGGNFNLQVGTTGSVGLTTLLLGAIVWAKITLAGQFLAWLWFSVLLPLLLIFLAIMVTVLLRQALVIFLVIISPIAFALYCLPNTEKYFKKWWDMLFETLLVFPIVASLFAMGKVSAYLLSNSTNQSFLANGISNIMAVIALVIPLLLIPFSFKIAGGLIGRAYDLTKSARDKTGLGQATRERIKAQGARNRLQARGSAYAALQKQGSKGGAFRRNTIGRLAKGSSGLLGYNVEAEMSAARAEVGKTLNDQIATGKDDEIRGLTVNKAWAAHKDRGAFRYDAEGNYTNDYMRTTTKGVRQFKSLGGQWVNEADVDRGQSRWGRDTFAQQTALSYEMRKAQSEGQLQNLATNYKAIAQGGVDSEGKKIGGGWGMTDEEAGGAWIGAAFERQNEHLEFKSTDWRTGQLSQDSATAVKDAKGNNIKGTGLSGVGLVDEVYEKKGSYPVSQMGSNTIEQLKESFQSAERVLDGVDADGNAVTYTDAQRTAALDHQGKLQAIAETFMHEAGGADGIVIGQTESGENVVGNGAGKRQSSAQGAAHVAERVREFAVLTGSYERAPSGQYIKRDHAPTPNGREQK